MKLSHLAGVMALVVLSGGAQSRPHCGLTDAAFTAAVDGLRDWPSIARFHAQHFPPCADDGLYAEGYSDLIVRTLAQRWSSLPELSAVVRSKPDFLAFVVKHIDASADASQLDQIVQLAKRNCPRGSETLCKALQESALSALSEHQQARPPQGSALSASENRAPSAR